MSRPSTATRELLVSTALRLFREQGFQATTMRRIATEAGVSLGNAYYYFAGKDELVHELYVTVQREHREVALPALRRNEPLAANLRTVLHTGLDVMAPYHGFGTSFVQLALPTASRTSPFAAGSSEARSMAVALMEDAVAMSRHHPSAVLRNQLPTLLWFTYLGVTLHWVMDSSSGQARTRTLVDRLAPLVARAVNLSRLPVARALVDDVVQLVVTMTAPGQAPAPPDAPRTSTASMYDDTPQESR